ncbi:MAG: ABC transporter permease [Bacteroidota bacterium]
MIPLLKVEWFKILRQRRTYYGLAALLILEIVILFVSGYQGKEILDLLLSELTENFFLAGNLMNANLVLYLVLNSFWFNFPLILMIVVSGFLTTEYKDRTVQAKVLQSIAKRDLILAKYGVAIFFTLFVLCIMGGVASMAAYLFFGSGDLITYLGGVRFYEQADAAQRLFHAFWSGSVVMIFYSVASLTFGIYLKEPTTTWIVSAFFLTLCNIVLKLDLPFFQGWFFPQLIDTWQYMFYDPIPWPHISVQLLILLGYIVLFIALGVVRFERSDLE